MRASHYPHRRGDFRGRDVLSIVDFSRKDIEFILKAAKKMVPIARGERTSRSLEGKVLAVLFYEPSTRTRLGFESAMKRLGGSTVGFADPMGSSVAKGGTLADTVRIVESYSDAIVLRCGSHVRRASRAADGEGGRRARSGARPPVEHDGGPGEGRPGRRRPLRDAYPEGAVSGPPGIREGRGLLPHRPRRPAERTEGSHPAPPAPAHDGDRDGRRPDASRSVLRAGVQRRPRADGPPLDGPRGRRMRDLKVTPIRNGTVIDHIPSGRALKVLKVLGISGEGTSTVSVLMHVPSKQRGTKDIVKIEDRGGPP